MGPDGPKWGQEDFFLLIQTLPTFWAERIRVLIFFFIFFDFLGSQIPRFPGSQIVKIPEDEELGEKLVEICLVILGKAVKLTKTDMDDQLLEVVTKAIKNREE